MIAGALAIFVITMAAGALFAAYEAAAIASNRLNLVRSSTSRMPRAQGAYQMLSRQQTLLQLALAGETACCVAWSLCGVYLVSQIPVIARRGHLISVTSFAAMLIIVPIYVLIVRAAARRYFRRNSESIYLRATAPMLWLAGIYLPIIKSIELTVAKLLRPRATAEAARHGVKVTGDDLRHVLEQGGKARHLESIGRRMIAGVFDLEQTIVRELMQPLVNVAALQRSQLTQESVVRLSRESGYSMLPVFSNRVINLDGVLDVLAMLRSPAETPIDSFIRTPYYVPETMRADKLMRRMIRDHVDLAIVVDEFGGTVGLVTREDVIEEIVGEIEDEFDPARPTIIDEPDGSALLDGRMDVDDVNERFGLDLPNEDYDTLGGFIYDVVGRVPRVGDVVENEKLRVEVTSMDGKQVERVRLKVKSPEADDAGEQKQKK